MAYYRNGRHVHESTRTLDRAEAEAILRERLAVDAGAAPATFAALAEAFIATLKNPKSAYVHFEAAPTLKRFAALAGARSLADLASEGLAGYAASRAGTAHSWLTREVAVLRRAFRFAWRRGWVPKVPEVPALPEERAPAATAGPEPDQGGPLTVRRLIAIYVAELKDEGKSWYQTKSQCRPVERLLGGLDAEKLGPRDIEAYRATRRVEISLRGTPPSHSTINRELGFVRAALTRAHRRELLPRVPYFRMVSEKDARRTDWCPPEKLELILAHLRARFPDLADLIELYAHTGWRKRECLDLQWSEVRWDLGRIELPPARNKGRRLRIFPLAGRVRAVLERRRDAAPAGCPWVFHRGGRHRRGFEKAFYTAKVAAGHEGLKVHGFRRTYATMSMRAMVPTAITMKLAGWATDSIYRTYQIVDEEALKDGVARYEKYLEEAARGAR
jgi:integrase